MNMTSVLGAIFFNKKHETWNDVENQVEALVVERVIVWVFAAVGRNVNSVWHRTWGQAEELK